MSLHQRTTELKVFATINLGTGPANADDVRRSLAHDAMKISDWANEILGKVALSATAEEVDLVVASVEELTGLGGFATLERIYVAAKAAGLELCPAEVGPKLRLWHQNQPDHEWLFIGMEPIADADGILRVFLVERDEHGQWLSAIAARRHWPHAYRFVFVRRRPPQSETPQA
ncbi:hypothetical protein KW786_01905 [Candidatus Parcubacteria bacterium]|nr:hypothetical protein [Candidatus Parcubacteria bacterium]